MQRKFILFGAFFGGIGLQYQRQEATRQLHTAIGIIIPAMIVTYIERRKPNN